MKLPIRLTQHDNLIMDADKGIIGQTFEKEDAEIIINAVNNHEKLLDACKMALRTLDDIIASACEAANIDVPEGKSREALQLIEAIKAVEEQV